MSFLFVNIEICGRSTSGNFFIEQPFSRARVSPRLHRLLYFMVYFCILLHAFRDCYVHVPIILKILMKTYWKLVRKLFKKGQFRQKSGRLVTWEESTCRKVENTVNLRRIFFCLGWDELYRTMQFARKLTRWTLWNSLTMENSRFSWFPSILRTVFHNPIRLLWHELRNTESYGPKKDNL